MTQRHYLIVPTVAAAQRRLREAVVAAAGIVVLAAPSGALVARMPETAKEAIAARRDLRHCGGVELAPRPFRRIRVDQNGKRIGS